MKKGALPFFFSPLRTRAGVRCARVYGCACFDGVAGDRFGDAMLGGPAPPRDGALWPYYNGSVAMRAKVALGPGSLLANRAAAAEPCAARDSMRLAQAVAPPGAPFRFAEPIARDARAG